MFNAPQEIKASLRCLLRDRRKAANALGARTAALAIRDIFLTQITLPAHALVAAYMACGSEINPLPLLQELEARGHSLCLPCLSKDDGSLLFRAYALGDPLLIGAHNIPVPFSGAALVEPDVFLVPLIGFNRAGHRLGQGGGFYDRVLCRARSLRTIKAIGLAYSAQEEPSLPVESHDMRLDAIVTENGFLESFSP